MESRIPTGYDLYGCFPGECKSSLGDFKLKAESEFGKGKAEKKGLVGSLMMREGIEDLGKCLIESRIPALIITNIQSGLRLTRGYNDYELLRVYHLKGENRK